MSGTLLGVIKIKNGKPIGNPFFFMLETFMIFISKNISFLTLKIFIFLKFTKCLH